MGSRHVNIRDSHVSFLSVTPSGWKKHDSTVFNVLI